MRDVLAHDPVLGEIGVPEARSASRKATIYVLGGTLYAAVIPLSGSRHFDSAVPVWVSAAFGVDPPEVRHARLVADDATALDVWVDSSTGRVVQIDTNGRPVSYTWIGDPPPREPGD